MCYGVYEGAQPFSQGLRARECGAQTSGLSGGDRFGWMGAVITSQKNYATDPTVNGYYRQIRGCIFHEQVAWAGTVVDRQGCVGPELARLMGGRK